jgi:hypothetical protein
MYGLRGLNGGLMGMGGAWETLLWTAGARTCKPGDTACQQRNAVALLRVQQGQGGGTASVPVQSVAMPVASPKRAPIDWARLRRR